MERGVPWPIISLGTAMASTPGTCAAAPALASAVSTNVCLVQAA
jgi:hypothetical protein